MYGIVEDFNQETIIRILIQNLINLLQVCRH